MELPIQYQELETVYANTLGNGLRSLAICAAEPGEGVSTLAYALARRSEAGGRRTLLVELNLFRPRLAALLGAGASPWAQPGEMTHPLEAAPGSRLAVLPAPPASEALLALRERANISLHLESWLRQFEAVVVDTSPVNAVNRGNVPADIVCGCCEGTVMVVLAGRTRAASVSQARDRLAGSGARLVGTVFNDQFNPCLAQELCRETARFDGRWPRAMAALRTFIRRSHLLNMQA